MEGTQLDSTNLTCIIVGASHAGVNAAFALRNEGWIGKILLVDADKHLPYHRPPLSKKALTCAASELHVYLKPESSYSAANIELLLGRQVSNLNTSTQTLDIASSLKGLGLDVTVIEREERLLARVTAPVMSEFFQNLHQQKGVKILTNREVTSVSNSGNEQSVSCSDGTQLNVQMIIVGVGIRVNSELAGEAGLDINNGISVDEYNRTSSADVYAIGDCANFKHQMFAQKIRLESVQNAVDQAKLVAKNICGQLVNNTAVPWFWSDQYDYKLQMVGLSGGYNDLVIRTEPAAENSTATSFSVWYFKDDTLLSVDAVNNTKAYVIGTKTIQSGKQINLSVLKNAAEPLNPKTIFA